MSTTSNPSQRINVVDSLRGFAVVGIILIHFLEHLNFYMFPEPTPFDKGLWDTVFYLGSNKMYAIFALLFGLSCYIQHHNAETRGQDFRLRFAWRMVLLFLWGMLDLAFFNGDILCIYAVLGLFLIPLVKASDRVLIAIAFILFFQPIEMAYLLAGFVNPDIHPMDLGLGKYWNEAITACATGGFLDVAKTNLSCGLQLNFGWSIEHGRLTQTLLLFVIGMLLGRKKLFINEGGTLKFWKEAIKFAILMFVSMQLLLNLVSFGSMPSSIGQSLEAILTTWRNLAMTAFYVGCITLLYYKTRLRSAISHLSCIGKMSLTDYLLQSMLGAFIFYNWGLGLYSVSRHTISFLLGIAFCICLYCFCRFWAKRFRRGPLEELWARATHIKFNNYQ